MPPPPIYAPHIPRHTSDAPESDEGRLPATPLTSPCSARPRRWALHPESSRPIRTDPELSRPIQTEMTIRLHHPSASGLTLAWIRPVPTRPPKHPRPRWVGLGAYGL